MDKKQQRHVFYGYMQYMDIISVQKNPMLVHAESSDIIFLFLRLPCVHISTESWVSISYAQGDSGTYSYNFTEFIE